MTDDTQKQAAINAAPSVRAFACARRRDYPDDHFAHLMEHVTRSTLERRVAASRCATARRPACA